MLDEPFSALDVLTAENLRTDFRELWGEGQLPIQGMILVTHNIEEAVLMCDRVLLFSTNPGRIAGEIKIDMPRPRDRSDARFEAYVDRIYTEMTARQRVGVPTAATWSRHASDAHVSPNLVSGLIEAVAASPYNGKADLPDIASDLQMEIDELFPVAEALQTLRLGELEGGDIKLTHMGKRFADSSLNERKEIFSRALTAYVPLLGPYPARARRTHQPHRAQAPLHRRARRSHDRGRRRRNPAHHHQLGAVRRTVLIRGRERDVQPGKSDVGDDDEKNDLLSRSHSVSRSCRCRCEQYTQVRCSSGRTQKRRKSVIASLLRTFRKLSFQAD